MNNFLIKTILIITLGSNIFSPKIVKAESDKNVYSCIQEQGIPTTIVETKRGKIKLIVWESDYFRSSGWTPQKRCEEVTQRFQRFSDEGTLKQITTGKYNNFPVICVQDSSPGMQGQCLKDGLLLTLEVKDNPQEVLQNLFQAARDGNASPFKRGQSFNLVEYLQNAPLMETSPPPKPNVTKPPERSREIPPAAPEKDICPSLLCQ